MTYNQFSDSRCVYTFIQFIHTEFIKVVCAEYSAFTSLSKMSQEHATPALISEKNK